MKRTLFTRMLFRDDHELRSGSPFRLQHHGPGRRFRGQIRPEGGLEGRSVVSLLESDGERPRIRGLLVSGRFRPIRICTIIRQQKNMPGKASPIHEENDHHITIVSCGGFRVG